VDQATAMRAAEREAREMGVLTRAPMTARDDDEAASDDASTGPRDPGRGTPRIVPVTHPRNR
jgi:hypothetical protein